MTTAEENAAVEEEEDHPFVYGPNPLRLSGKDWVITIAVFLGILLCVPIIWPRLEKFTPAVDYRVPYDLSRDFWMYSRWCEYASAHYPILIIGDSAIWGHYVDSKDTFSQCLNRLAGEDIYCNMGLSGLHNVALAGLLKYHGKAISGKKVILHFPPLWMHSLKADLQGEKEFHFQHKELAPQFWPALKCYKADTETRLTKLVGQHSSFTTLMNHITINYFDNTNVPQWITENPYKNPLSEVTFDVPSSASKAQDEPVIWFNKIKRKVNYAWVMPDESFQWKFFKKAIGTLKSRDNKIFVLIGPFNPYVLTPESQVRYRALVKEIEGWLKEHEIRYFLAPDLPSEEYGDASHPLKNGYMMIAKALFDDNSFQEWREQP